MSMSTPYSYIGATVVYLHEFCTPSLDGSQWLASHPGYYGWEKNYQQPLYRWLCGPRPSMGILMKTQISYTCQQSIPGSSSLQFSHYS